MKKYLFTILMILGVTIICHAQNHKYQYKTITLDSSFDAKIDPSLQKYILKQKKKMDNKMNIVIGHCSEEIIAFDPISPLSNLLTDLLLTHAPTYCTDSYFHSCDISLLNFGGIRSNLPKGDITIGNIFQLAPFDNKLVFIDINGKELRKAVLRLTERDCKAAFSGLEITFLSGKPYKITLQGEPLNDEKNYRLITLDFIATGGDNILSNLQFSRTNFTEILYRDFLIQEFQKIHQSGKSIQGKMDNRVVILPQP